MGINDVIHLLVSLLFLTSASGECPWTRSDPEASPLNAACLCARNDNGEFSLQCSAVNFPLLMSNLHGKPKDIQFDLLYVNNSDVGVLRDRTFMGLRIRNLQVSFSRISNITDRAFEGLENSLENLNLQNNLLQEVPTRPLIPLQTLVLLDLSGNKFTRIPKQAFFGLQITTLKLSSNSAVISPEAFQGLEDHLKNLNMKGCQLRTVPEAVRGLHSLAFLDLAQNEIRSLQPGVFEPLDSLTALNMERNLLQDLDPDVFRGVTDTLSSLSLLNNLLTKFPIRAINSLPQLRVLDIGFNLITRLPDNAFRNIKALTLLAVDGNPLTSVPEKAFLHLNGTLRGLSLGGHYFHCDCNLAWVIGWIQNFDLQVTSRDQDPQFCGQPVALRNKSFYQLTPADLVCVNKDQEVSASKPNEALPEVKNEAKPTGEVVTKKPEPKLPEIKANPEVKVPKPEIRVPSKPQAALPEKKVEPPRKRPTTAVAPKQQSSIESEEVSTYKPPLPTSRPLGPTQPPPKRRPAPKGEVEFQGGRLPVRESQEGLKKRKKMGTVVIDNEKKRPRGEKAEERDSIRSQNRGHVSKSRLPPLIRRPSESPQNPEDFYSSSSNNRLYGEEVIVQDAYWDNNAISIQWDSEISNILGFRVVYRLFGDKYFKMGQPLAPTAREFKIKNVPANEYFVACVVSLEEMDIQLESVPFGQCREIRTGDASGKLSTHMDKIIIAASASICGTVIIAVIIFICCYRGKNKVENEKQGVPAVLNHSSPPLASLGTLGNPKSPDWDTISMYSQRSIPRARMYHHQVDKEDTRSHISHMSTKSRPRSLADGQSQRSFSGMSGVHAPNPHFASPLSLSRPDLRLSRQSLAHSQFGSSQFGSGYPHFANNGGMLSRATSHRSERRRSSSRSKSRERTSSRLSHAGSSHSLTGYDTDGWTDHDMDIYMARNPTRGGLVQL